MVYIILLHIADNQFSSING